MQIVRVKIAQRDSTCGGENVSLKDQSAKGKIFKEYAPNVSKASKFKEESAIESSHLLKTQ